jgi:hypothetical protein
MENYDLEKINDSFPSLHTNSGGLAEKLLKILIPYDISNSTYWRIGGDHDGGYIILDRGMEEVEVLYSVGINYDTGFQKEMLA